MSHFLLHYMISISLITPTSQIGDGTNFVLVLAGALLEHAEDLLRMGLSPSEVIEGYQMASQKAIDILPSKTRTNISLAQARWLGVVWYLLPGFCEWCWNVDPMI